MRLGSILATVVLSLFVHAALADDAATFVVQEGAAPWADRVGNWELGDVPDSLKSSDPVPQQDCNSRSLTIAGQPKSITFAVDEADLPKLKEKFPDAKETGDKITIRHPKETTGLTYHVVTLATPPATISGGDTPFGGGLVLLKIEPGDSTTQPTTKP